MSESLWKNSVIGHIDELDDDEDEVSEIDLNHFHVVLSVPVFGTLVLWAIIGVAATVGRGISLFRR